MFRMIRHIPLIVAAIAVMVVVAVGVAAPKPQPANPFTVTGVDEVAYNGAKWDTVGTPPWQRLLIGFQQNQNVDKQQNYSMRLECSGVRDTYEGIMPWSSDLLDGEGGLGLPTGGSFPRAGSIYFWVTVTSDTDPLDCSAYLINRDTRDVLSNTLHLTIP